MRKIARRPAPAAVALALAAALIAVLALFGGCAADSSIAARGAILSSDGAVLAESQDVVDGQGRRVYPLGQKAAPVVGSCYAQGAPEGIEQACADVLLQGEDVRLTLDSRLQDAAFDALGDYAGAVVVLNPVTGAVLAMASTPSFDPAQQQPPQGDVANHATELHIPGSTFKTITLASALESGAASIDEIFPAPSELMFDDGDIHNFGVEHYGEMPLSQAYAQSVNTVFAQLGLRVGVDELVAASRRFGFDDQLLDEVPCEASTVLGAGEMTPFMQGWTGVGQALYQQDGTLQGPVMTPLQGAVIAAAVMNGGVVAKPFIIAGEGLASGATGAGERAISAQTASQVADCMRAVVASGTGASAAVAGIDVGGKTGTAETKSGADDGWFIGFAQDDRETYALAVMVEDAQSAEACVVAHSFIAAAFQPDKEPDK